MVNRVCGLLALWSVSFLPVSAQVVYSGRKYLVDGRSYQQIMALDLSTGRARGLSTAARHHWSPVCSPDGKAIWFLAGPPGGDHSELWTLDRASGVERRMLTLPGITRLAGASGKGVVFEAAGAVYRFQGKPVKLAPGIAAAVSPDGARLAWLAGSELFLMDAGGKRLGSFGPCGAGVWSRTGRQVACASDKAIRILAVPSRQEVETIPLDGRKGSLEGWSPDGRRFLVATLGANSNSSSPQSDYWVYDRQTAQWQALPEPGNQALWTGAVSIVLATPRELTSYGPSGKQPGGRARGEWTTELKLITLGGRPGVKTLVSGISYNVDPSLCQAVK